MTKKKDTKQGNVIPLGPIEIDPQLEAAGELGRAYDDWVSEGLVAIPIVEAYETFHGAEEATNDIERIFVAFRCSKGTALTFPVEIALTGYTAGHKIFLWSTRIAPDPSWLDPSGDDSLASLDDGMPAALAAREVMDRIRRTPSGCVYSYQNEMMKMLMDQHPDLNCEVPVFPPYLLFRSYPDTRDLEEVFRDFLNDTPTEEDPRLEAISLGEGLKSILKRTSFFRSVAHLNTNKSSRGDH